MKRYLIIGIFVAVIFLSGVVNTHASTLSCFQVDGMAIFGYKYGKWEFIGAIANEFDSDSIANEFGAGNEFKSDSIFNEFGSFGSEFSSYSAFNKFASNPPIIVNDNYKFVGYLTINDFKTPNINTYEAIACAKNSFRSFSNSDLEDTVFKSIPSGSSYSGSSGYSQQDLENLLKNSCPSNSTYTNSECFCNDGYVANGSVCITQTQSCQLKYGSNSYGDKQYCYCSNGFEFNSNKTACVQSVLCPTNTTKISGSCVCNEGFVMRNGQCITHTADCRLSFGENVIGTKGNAGNSSCNCEIGYVWNATHTACIKAEVKPISAPTQPTERKIDVAPSPQPVKNKQVTQSIKKEFAEEKPKGEIADETSTSSPSEKSEVEAKKAEGGFFIKVFNSIKGFFSIIFKWVYEPKF